MKGGGIGANMFEAARFHILSDVFAAVPVANAKAPYRLARLIGSFNSPLYSWYC